MNLFYAPDISGDSYTFSAEESKHIIKVLRKSTNDLVYLTDGRGFMFTTEIIMANPRACEVSVIKKEEGEDKRNFYLQIAIAPTKNINRFEWFLEKSTEIGIDRISPVFCQHSERKLVKTERLNKVIVSAMKQSLKSVIPVLDEPNSFQKFITLPFEGEKFIAHLGSDKTPELSKKYLSGKNALVVIGPEGDFSSEEIKLAEQNGFVQVKLGPSRLRTETAGLVACQSINLLNL
jgi:16S rRNA (uracil1498-N3)-methyltransferase